jgi:MFS transporter, FHS family, Na+ dependent glucose transporter 1
VRRVQAPSELRSTPPGRRIARAVAGAAGEPTHAYLSGFVLLGLTASFGGPALSHLKAQVGTVDGGIGWIFVGQAAAYTVSSLLGGRLVDRGWGQRMWAVAAIVAMLMPIAIAAATSLVVLVACFALLGMCTGSADAAANTLVVWSRPGDSTTLMNGLHLCFALGALLSPLTVYVALQLTDSVWPVALSAGALAAVTVPWLLARPSPPPLPVGNRQPTKSANAVTERSARRVVIGGACVFYVLYVSLEAGVAGWIHRYAEDAMPGNDLVATGVTVSFWSGFTAGRIGAVWWGRRADPARMLVVSMLAALACAVVFLTVARDGAALWVITFVLAVTIAPQFAAMMSHVESTVGLDGAATSAFIASSGIGSLTAPFVIGLCFDNYGFESLPVVVLVAAVLATAASMSVVALSGRR